MLSLIRLLLFSALAVGSFAYAVNPTTSKVEFSVAHLMGASVVKGYFAEFNGKIVYDPGDPSHASVDWEIQTSSVNTSNRSRDKDLRGAKYLDAEHFPTIQFHSQTVQSPAPDRLEVTGDFTLHGVTKTISVPIVVHDDSFECDFKVLRSHYGMPLDMVLAGDEVSIHLHVHSVKGESL